MTQLAVDAAAAGAVVVANIIITLSIINETIFAAKKEFMTREGLFPTLIVSDAIALFQFGGNSFLVF